MPAPDTSDQQRFAGALLGRAEEDRRRLLREANEEAQRLLQEAERQMARLRAERLDAARRRARERLDYQLSEIRQEQRAGEARLLDEARGRAIDAAHQQLGGMRERPDYTAHLRRMLDHALDELGTEAGVILTIDERDRESVAAAVRHRGSSAIEVVTGGPFLGGLQVATRDGRSMIDHTFDARRRARLPSIHVRLAEVFGRSN